MTSVSPSQPLPASSRPQAVGIPSISQQLDAATTATPSTGSNVPHDDGYDNDPDADLDDEDEGEGGFAGTTVDLGQNSYPVFNEHIVRSGYLLKRGEKRKTWKKRWFVLRASKLAYYKNEKEYQLLRFIDMSEVHTVAAVELKGKEFTFGIVTPSRTYYVNAGSRQEMQAWIDDLNAVKENAAQTYSTDSAATEQQPMGQQPLSQQRAPSTPSGIQPSNLAFTNEDLASLGPAPPMVPGASAASASANANAAAAVLSSSDEGEQDDDWDEDEIADQAMPLPGPALGLSTSATAGAQLSTSPSAMYSSSLQQQQQQQLQLQQATNVPQPKRGSSLLNQPNKVIMQGYLMKQSKGRKHWRKRWFVLSSSKLLYAKDHMNTKAHRIIPISSILDAIEYDYVEKEKDRDRERDRERDNSVGVSSESSGAVLGSSPIITGSSRDTAAAARGAVAGAGGLTDSGSELERERDHKFRPSRQRSRSRDQSDGGASASGAGVGAAGGAGSGSAGPSGALAIPGSSGAGAAGASSSGAAPASALLSTSATSSSIAHGSTSADHSTGSTTAPSAGVITSSPILIPTTSPKPPTAQLAATSLSSSAATGDTTGIRPAKSRENCFKIITPKRVYLVCAPSEEEEIKWLSALRALLSARR
ncbi:hypothetical protein OC846_000279 [Tilletia horrida]|uniref:PH domain-containing protein n=1 Tax=Tilletia horrida TaxID=155126 RepID=A0AAN6GVZ2_9BASI|nr:hypothetical protein OC846_000279 [Tilletia horrida]KAK0570313.1 hypothetical protein OC861_000056 [Tilletia horrida]